MDRVGKVSRQAGDARDTLSALLHLLEEVKTPASLVG